MKECYSEFTSWIFSCHGSPPQLLTDVIQSQAVPGVHTAFVASKETFLYRYFFGLEIDILLAVDFSILTTRFDVV